jgi:uncharacterized secreted protein with C-terminal beta-propeller domain
MVGDEFSGKELPMLEISVHKSWKVTVTLLDLAWRAPPRPSKECEQAWANLLTQYHHYLENNELELAFDPLDQLGHLTTCRGGFLA